MNRISDMSSLDSLGSNLSLVGSFDVMRIDIVVSELCEKKGKPRGAARKPNGKPSPSIPEELPAFLCERVGVELEVLKVTDGLSDDNKPNALYVSRGQLKKLTSTMINFSFNVRYISQQVCGPTRLCYELLRSYQNAHQHFYYEIGDIAFVHALSHRRSICRCSVSCIKSPTCIKM